MHRTHRDSIRKRELPWKTRSVCHRILSKTKRLDIPSSVNEIIITSTNPGFQDLDSLACISYLGAKDFSSHEFIRGGTSANIYVSSSHPDKFGGHSVTGRDKTCNVSTLPLNYDEYNAGKERSHVIRRCFSCYVYYMIFLVSS